MPYIVGLARALELAEQHFEDEETRVRGLRDRLERSIEATIPNVQVNGRGAARLPNTLNVSCHFVEGEGMLYQLSDAGICASSGSACTSGSLEPSHVLRAMKVPFTAVHGSVRFSLSRYNTDADIDHILEGLSRRGGQSSPLVALLGPAAERPAGRRRGIGPGEPAEREQNSGFRDCPSIVGWAE